MPLPQHFNAVLGAGVFGIVCAATLYVVEHYRQDRRRHAMAKDLARLNNELGVLRQELDTLLAQQKHKVAKRAKKAKAHSIISSSTTEDYASAFEADSSDLEFYDVSDDEVDASNFETDLQRIDSCLDDGDASELLSCVEQLENLRSEFPSNPQLLWRLGKAHYKLFTKTDETAHIAKGIDACTAALTMKPELANVHKWLAILVGERTKLQPIKDKILDGHLFKQHVDQAVRLDPLDPSLHHMLGRFAYDVAELKWYERKVASALYAELPTATHSDALEHFLEAERLSKTAWKENMLFVAKCMIKLGKVEEAVKVLEKAEGVSEENGEDDAVDTEIKDLLNKNRR